MELCRRSRVHCIVVLVALLVGLPLTAAAEANIGAEVISSGGAPGQSTSYRMHDTVGQGPIGPMAEGNGMRAHDGFWLVFPSINVPVEGSFFASPRDDGTVILRWVVQSLDGISGFRVHRSTSEEGPFELVSDLLPRETPGSFVDETVWPETAFWYELHAMLYDGSEDVVLGSPATVATGGKLTLALHPFWPNPVLESSQVRFDIPDHIGSVRLAIYNVNGQEVTELANGPVNRGRYDLTWNSRDFQGNRLAAGVYFARLEVDGKSKRQKVLVLR